LLEERGIEIGIRRVQAPVTAQHTSRHRPDEIEIAAGDQTPRAELAAQQVLSLPVHPALAGADISRIVSCLREALEQ
jgi:dTDP-4-amino-4,6-dideoxygalactose transaminase